MSNYKRLTKKENGRWGIDGKLVNQSQKPLDVFEEAFNIAVKHLAELEDKIENGTLIELNKPYIILNYVSNGKEYYSICMAKEEELHINLTKAEAEEKLKELGEV